MSASSETDPPKENKNQFKLEHNIRQLQAQLTRLKLIYQVHELIHTVFGGMAYLEHQLPRRQMIESIENEIAELINKLPDNHPFKRQLYRKQRGWHSSHTERQPIALRPHERRSLLKAMGVNETQTQDPAVKKALKTVKDGVTRANSSVTFIGNGGQTTTNRAHLPKKARKIAGVTGTRGNSRLHHTSLRIIYQKISWIITRYFHLKSHPFQLVFVACNFQV